MATFPLITAVLRTGADGSGAPSTQSLTIPRGETVIQPFQVVDESGAPVDITDYTITASFGPDSGLATFTGVTTIDVGVNGTGSFSLTSAQTDLTLTVIYWDLEAVDTDGNASKIVFQSRCLIAGGVYAAP